MGECSHVSSFSTELISYELIRDHKNWEVVRAIGNHADIGLDYEVQVYNCRWNSLFVL